MRMYMRTSIHFTMVLARRSAFNVGPARRNGNHSKHNIEEAGGGKNPQTVNPQIVHLILARLDCQPLLQFKPGTNIACVSVSDYATSANATASQLKSTSSKTFCKTSYNHPPMHAFLGKTNDLDGCLCKTLHETHTSTRPCKFSLETQMNWTGACVKPYTNLTQAPAHDSFHWKY